MTHFITWRDREGMREPLGAICMVKQDNMLKRMSYGLEVVWILYTENLKTVSLLCLQ